MFIDVIFLENAQYEFISKILMIKKVCIESFITVCIILL